METIIKQAEEAKRNSQESARRLYEEYRPMKHDVDIMRTELLGLDKLADIAPEDKEKMAAIGIMDKPKYPMDQWHHAHAAAAAAAAHHHQQQLAAAAAAVASGGDEKSFAASLMSHAARSGQPQGAPHPPPNNPFLAAAAAQHSAMGLGPLTMGSTKPLGGQPTGPAPPPFRQQPPPMKSCLSCHQQIHRNAPICPLCKAKSRSRNPKKPKKRPE